MSTVLPFLSVSNKNFFWNNWPFWSFNKRKSVTFYAWKLRQWTTFNMMLGIGWHWEKL